MEIKKIQIENYKGISKLMFSPNKINILVGKNNTGKTSILDAIDLLFNNEHIIPKDMKSDMKSYFNIYSKERRIIVSANTDSGIKKITVEETSEIEIVNKFVEDVVRNFLKALSPSKQEKFNSIAIKELEKVALRYIDDSLRMFLLKNSLALKNEKGKKCLYYNLPIHNDNFELLIKKLNNYVFEKIIPSKSYQFGEGSSGNLLDYLTIRYMDEERRELRTLDKNILLIYNLLEEFGGEEQFTRRKPEDSEKLHEIEQSIKKNNLISNLEGLDFDNVLLTTEKGIKAHSFEFLGDGFKAIIGLLWRFSGTKNNTIILLDEPENHMHPGYIEQLIKFIIDFSKKSNIQFFITTHSSDVLDIFLSDDLDEEHKTYMKKELNLLRMDKVKDSITLAESLDYKDAKESQEKLLLDLRGI